MTTTNQATLSHLTFGGVLNSEWIKLRTLRSTLWCYLIVIVLSVLFGLLVVSVASRIPHGSAEAQRSFAVSVSTSGISLSVLVVAVLGALVITGEYGTGMIRSTLTAVPKRTPALVAKTLVFGVSTFIVGIVAIGATALITAPLLPNAGVHVNLTDSRILLPLLGGAGYLALIGIMSLALGSIIRNSAGGIAAALGLVFVVRILFGILEAVTQAKWVGNLAALFPAEAGADLYAYQSTPTPPAPSGVWVLNAWQGGLVLLAWVVVLWIIAEILLKVRDA
jgi:ABC-2 type transport system permease protein